VCVVHDSENHSELWEDTAHRRRQHPTMRLATAALAVAGLAVKPTSGAVVHSTSVSARGDPFHAGGGGGGAQIYAEQLGRHHREHRSVAHPTRADRPNVVSTGTSGLAAYAVSTGENTIGADGSGGGAVPFTHFFEQSVGSGHMSLTLRADWRSHVAMAAKDLGVRHIRGHGLLDDDMSVSYGRHLNAYYNVDSLVDFLDSVGMRPIFELSFMPSWLTRCVRVCVCVCIFVWV
jgi:hypothetical protein